MAKLTRSVTINAPVEAVFDLAKDVGRFWTCWPGVAVREVELTADGVGSSGHFYTHFLGIHMEGHVEYTEVVLNERIVAKVTSAGETPTWVFTFAPVEGGTTLTAEAEWHVNLPAVGKPIEGLMVKGHEGELEHWLTSIKHQFVAEAA